MYFPKQPPALSVVQMPVVGPGIDASVAIDAVGWIEQGDPQSAKSPDRSETSPRTSAQCLEKHREGHERTGILVGTLSLRD